MPSEPPVLDSVVCKADCRGLDRVRPGSLLRITGTSLGSVVQVQFAGRRGRRDDRYAQVANVTPDAVEVVVPKGARSGRVRVIETGGRRSGASRQRVLLGGKRGPALQARVDARRVFIGGQRKASVSFFVAKSTNIAVALVKRGDPNPVAGWLPGSVPAGTVQTVEWDGLINGQPPAEGRYDFQVYASAGEARAAQSTPSAVASFLLLSHRFPILGVHDYGGHAASFGGGRGHEGQDVFAACGTPLVAAEGGTVKFKATHERAGNYIVISGEQGQFDYAYMHLREAALVEKGDRVATGQPIGFVGQTGRASGCHLHFEMWSAPGWYSGGSAVDPLPFLQAWDTAS